MSGIKRGEAFSFRKRGSGYIDRPFMAAGLTTGDRLIRAFLCIRDSKS